MPQAAIGSVKKIKPRMMTRGKDEDGNSITYERPGGWEARVTYTAEGVRHTTRVTLPTWTKATDALAKIKRELRALGPDEYHRRKSAAEHPLQELPAPATKPANDERTFQHLAIFYRRRYARPPRMRDGRRSEGLESWKQVRQQVRTLMDLMDKGRPLSEITFELVRDAKMKRLDTPVQMAGWKKSRPRSYANVNRLLGVLKRMFKVGMRMHWMAENPFDVVEESSREKLIQLGMEKSRSRVISPKEEAALLEQLKGRYLQRSLPAILLLLHTGARAGEILYAERSDRDKRRVRWTDVDFTSKVITVYASKTERERKVGMTPRLVTALRELRKRQNVSDGAEVFSGLTYSVVRDDFETACAAAGITGLRLHDLRHSRATRWIQGGLGESEVAYLLGHSPKSNTTRRYINPDSRTITRSLAADARFTKEHGKMSIN